MTVLLEYFNEALYINQWASVIQTNSLIRTLLANYKNKAVQITKDPLYYTYKFNIIASKTCGISDRIPPKKWQMNGKRFGGGEMTSFQVSKAVLATSMITMGKA